MVMQEFDQAVATTVLYCGLAISVSHPNRYQTFVVAAVAGQRIVPSMGLPSNLAVASVLH